MRKRFIAIVVALAVIMAVAIIAQRFVDDGESSQIVIGLATDIETLNPLLRRNLSETTILNCLFRNLLVTTDTGEFAPGIAKEVPTVENGGISEDGLVYTFRLRDDVRWHDGEPCDAHDVKFTYDLIMSGEVPVVSTSGYDGISEFEVIDDYTIRMTLKEKNVAFLHCWSGPLLIPEHLWRDIPPAGMKGNRLSTEPVGNGPYKLVEIGESLSHVVLERWDEYWGKRAGIDRVVFKIIPDSNNLVTQLETGEVQLAQPDPSFYEHVKNIKGLKVTVDPASSYHTMALNLENPILSDKAVRQALLHAFPRKKIIENVLGGVGVYANAPFFPGSWAYNPDVKDHPYDIEKAKAILDEAGWIDADGDGIREKDGFELRLRIDTNAGRVDRAQIAEIAREEWRKIGVDVNVRLLESMATLAQVLGSGEFDIMLFGLVAPPDPDQTSMLSSDRIPYENNGYGQNFSRYKNTEMDELLAKAKNELSQEKRRELYYRVQEIFAEDLPYFIIHYFREVNARPENLKNFKPSGTTAGYTWNIEEWKLD